MEAVEKYLLVWFDIPQRYGHDGIRDFRYAPFFAYLLLRSSLALLCPALL